MRILHVASEVAPFSKTGGLADVVGALPRALAELGFDVSVVTPLHRSVDPERFGLTRRLPTLAVPLGDDRVEVALYEGALPGDPRVRLWFVDHPLSFDRAGLYGEPGSTDYPDN